MKGFGKDRPLDIRDYVISADEKTSVYARQRKRATLGPKPGQVMHIEHEYIRKGARACKPGNELGTLRFNRKGVLDY